ncbi:glutamate--tRNA ligase, partial [Candidatus Peregrinibacteria bacterium]|nr:glutamate--tRNA ligase [Candidatus Peregrinibacteria bacterium]
MLHVGSLRTALYTYVLAKKTDGKFLMRIEDTDRAREVPGAIENFLTNLAWAGIVPDEGVMLKDGVITQAGPHAPYLQSERKETGIYKKYADELVKKGHAYPCFCTSERLEEMRKQQEQRHQPPMYDRRCMELPGHEIKSRLDASEPHVIRLKVPHERTITFSDDIRGPLNFQGHTVDDQVLLKSDGFPTYHLAHVVDDHLMEIDLVTRGEEWLSSLPKHLLLFEFLGWSPPRYAHVPLLLNADKTKLSKRQNSVSVDEYRNKGYLPEALINFLALLGWNPGTT